jgi:SAM-dependent methyltransferase
MLTLTEDLMRHPGDGMTEVVWESANSYKALPDLATSRAARSTVVDLIKCTITDKEKAYSVFSLGIGSGALYKNLLKKEIKDGKLRVLGIEHDKYLYERAVEDFPGDYMKASHFNNVEEKCSSIIQRSLLAPIEIYENSMDIVESRFTLQGLLFQKQLAVVLDRVNKILKPGGMFIVSGIDCWIGSYIEKKVLTLKRFYSEVTVDPRRALIVCKKGRVMEFPILDTGNHSDQEALKSMKKLTLDALKIEGELLGKIGCEEFISSDCEDGFKGRLWYRTKEEWVEMLKAAFGPNIQMKVITPQEIRHLYNDVHDNPFLIMVTKTS